jgi:uncharacterized membrane protein
LLPVLESTATTQTTHKPKTKIMTTVILILFYLGTPALIIFLCHRYPFFNRIGAVVITYIIGLLIGNLGILPDNIMGLQDMLNTLTIPLAIPLMLFAMDVRKWLGMAPKTLLSMLAAFIGVIVTVVTGHLILRGYRPDDLWQISGLLVGVYTGGTPNMASIKIALGVDESLYIMTHTYDLVIGAFYLMFMLTIGKRFFRLFLPDFNHGRSRLEPGKVFAGMESWTGFFTKTALISMAKALGLAVLIFGIGGSLTFIIPENSQMAVVILTITTLGILASLIPGVNRLEKTFELGMYLILVFSLVVSSMANLSQLADISLVVLGYVIFVMFGSLLLQMFISRLFKIDTDTMMITSTAFICSPPFVPVVASAIRNKEVIISGLTVGIIGYAVGNYLGVTLAYLLK